MDLNIKNKFFYSLISSYGYEFGKKYEVLDVLNTEKYNKSPMKDFCIVVVDKQDGSEKGDQFFATMFSIHFTDDYKKVIESIRDRILTESKELNKLIPIKKETELKVNELEESIKNLRDLSREIHLNNKKI